MSELLKRPNRPYLGHLDCKLYKMLPKLIPDINIKVFSQLAACQLSPELFKEHLWMLDRSLKKAMRKADQRGVNNERIISCELMMDKAIDYNNYIVVKNKSVYCVCKAIS